ncbi:competence/damage-inducible protein A [Salinisphaera orenii]|uniref:competence/damage-inducible protein A n=1 Tax=Salinisphaera orenii TaxID=856731 RepID=UPI000DBE46E3
MTQSKPPLAVGLLLIGDEILSGKRVDKHMPKVIELLNERGLSLSWARFVGDDPTVLQTNLAETLASDAVVFSFGGIGATPDDRTRQCAAAAAGVELEISAEGRALLEAKFKRDPSDARMKMVEWPVGSTVIPNPINQVPGFSFGHHHFVPGFPNMAWPMVEWVLDTYYAAYQSEADVEYSVEVFDTPESALVDLMQSVMDAHPDVRIACLPSADGRRVIEFGVRGPRVAVAPAFEALVATLDAAEVPTGPHTTH